MCAEPAINSRDFHCEHKGTHMSYIHLLHINKRICTIKDTRSQQEKDESKEPKENPKRKRESAAQKIPIIIYSFFFFSILAKSRSQA